jgi:hypothetical protein
MQNTNNIEKEKLTEVKMNYHKISLYILLIASLLLILVTVYKIFFSNNSPDILNKKKEVIISVETTTANIVSESEKEEKVFQDSNNLYTVSYEYPKNNEIVKNKIENYFKGWLEENSPDATELSQMNPEMKYSFTATYKVTSSANTKSYIYEIYSFTGGAHGGLTLLPITFDQEGNEINIEKILPAKSLKKVSEIAFVQLQKLRKDKLFAQKLTSKEVSDILKDTSMIKEGTNPVRDNYSTAWLDAEDVVIYFGQYQIASYAEGDFEIRIPVKDL